MRNTTTTLTKRESKLKSWLKSFFGIQVKQLTVPVTRRGPKGKPIRQYSLNGEFIKEFPSTTIAAIETGIAQCNISKVLNKKPYCHSAGGYVWKFVNPKKVKK